MGDTPSMKIFKSCVLVIFFLVALASIHHTSKPVSTQSELSVQQALAFEESGPITILLDSDFPRLGFPGNGTYNDPFLIENLSITSPDNIRISNVDSYFVIRDCLLMNIGGQAAVKFVNTSNGLIDSCTIISEHNGIVFENAEKCNIFNTIVEEAEQNGFYFQQSYNCSVIDCTVSESFGGIYVYESSLFKVVRCDVGKNAVEGLYNIRGHNWLIANNSFHENGGSGVRISSTAENCTIVGNLIYDNRGYGIWMENGVNCISYGNAIGWNIDGNALESYNGNLWDDSVNKGNRWSDYNSSENYTIPGGFGSLDNYPEPIDDYAPISDSPDDTLAEQGVWNQEIVWNTYDDFPMSYAITRNDTLINHGPWRNGPVSIEIDSRTLGPFEYILTLFDRMGNSHQDSVIVSIVDTTAPTISHPDDIVLLAGVDSLNFTWYPFDLNPSSYEIWSNDVQFASGLWNSSSESLNVYEESPIEGSYSYNVTVTDSFGQSSSDIVIVLVETDLVAPSITGPTNIEFQVGSQDNYLAWTFYDAYPANYSVLLFDTSIYEGTWNVSDFSLILDLDDLDVGVYNYTVVVTDKSNNVNEFLTVVSVLPTTTPVDEGEAMYETLSLAFGVMGSLGIIAVTAHVIKTSRELRWAKEMNS